MKSKTNKTGFVISCILCGLVLLLGSYTALFTTQGESSGFLDIPASAKKAEIVSETLSAIKNTEKKSAVSSKKVVTAASKGVVKGKVFDKYISPYTANTSYKNIYLKNNTELKLDLKSLYNSKLKYKIGKSKAPRVLILHTHATECFFKEDKDYYTSADKSRTTDKSENMVAIGKIVAKKLNDSGISTLQDTTLHDYPDYNQSYARAADTICSYLDKYPSLKVVIDLHRDSVENNGDKVKLTKTVNGKSAAQIMLVMGSQSGGVTNFPNYRENLKLALKIQSKTEEMYPGLARSIMFNSKNYNESLSLGSVLIEVGTDANSLEEAKYSAELIGNVLAELFGEL